MSHKNRHSLFYYRQQSLVAFFSVFFLLYPTLNLYTAMLSPSQIHDVATFFDLFVPFIPSVISVYNLSGVMLVLGFFLVKDGENLAHYTYRLIVATLVACLCFYFLPLRFSFTLPTQPAAYQSFGINWQPAYQLLHSMDKPFNQLPSLHAAYAGIVAVSLWQPLPYFTRQKTLYRCLVTAVCGAIAIATLLTWQHHVLDVIAGLVLAGAVVWAETRLYAAQGRTRLALIVKYTVVAIAGFLLLQTVPVLLLGQSLPLVWQILVNLLSSYWLISFGLLAVAYGVGNTTLVPLMFAKNSQGKLGGIGWLLQLPIIMIYRSLWHMAIELKLANTANLQSLVRLNHSLSTMAIANPTPQDVDVLQSLIKPYQRVIWLDLASEMESHFSQFLANVEPNFSKKIHYCSVSLLDLQPFDEFLQDDIRAVIDRITAKMFGDTLIICQCAMGWSRSVAMVGSLLAYFSELSPEEIRQILIECYPQNHVNAWYLTMDVLVFLHQQNHDKLSINREFKSI